MTVYEFRSEVEIQAILKHELIPVPLSLADREVPLQVFPAISGFSTVSLSRAYRATSPVDTAIVVSCGCSNLKQFSFKILSLT